MISDARIRALAAAWARKDFKLAESFLGNHDNFGLNEVLKALQLLDAGRQARVLEKKMKMLQVSKNKVKSTTMGKLKSDIDNLNKMKSPVRSLSLSSQQLFLKLYIIICIKRVMVIYIDHFIPVIGK